MAAICGRRSRCSVYRGSTRLKIPGSACCERVNTGFRHPTAARSPITLFMLSDRIQMNSLSLRARFADAPRTLVLAGLLLTVLMVMLRPSGAQAFLPASVLVYADKDENSQSFSVDIDPTRTVQRDYDVVPKNKTTPTKLTLTGVPLADLFSGLPDVDVTKVPYVKIRFGTSDAYSMLVALNGGPDSTPPPMILTKGDRPGAGSFPTPAIVPGQPDPAKPIFESQIQPFDRREDDLSIVPMTGGIFEVKISHTKRNKKGQIKFTAKAVGAPGGALSYKWFAFEEDGQVREVGQKKTWTTDNARGATAVYGVRVLVTAAADGSTGMQSDTYVSSRTDDGATKDPGYGDPPPGGGGGGGGGDTGVTGGGGTPAPTTPSQPFPPATTTPTPTPEPTPPTSQPTPPTSETTTPETTTPAVDTSGVVKAAQAVTVSDDMPVVDVSGVVLGTSSAPAAGGGGGGGGGATPGLTPLQQSAASLAESIFKPVDDPGDLWPFLVTLLFALGISGGVREWINP